MKQINVIETLSLCVRLDANVKRFELKKYHLIKCHTHTHRVGQFFLLKIEMYKKKVKTLY